VSSSEFSLASGGHVFTLPKPVVDAPKLVKTLAPIRATYNTGSFGAKAGLRSIYGTARPFG